MDWIAWGLLILFAGLGLFCLLLVVVGLPGTWALLAIAFGFELVDALLLPGAGAVVTFGWGLLAICAGLAVFVEGRPLAALAIRTDGRKILDVYSILNPEKLRGFEAFSH